MKKFIPFAILMLIVSTSLFGCSKVEDKPKEATENKLTVYTTVYPLQYMTEQIAGEYVNVESIYPPGADEHTYEPTQKNMINLAEADLFFYIGLGLEGFVEKAKTTLKTEKVQFIPVGESLNLSVTESEIEVEQNTHDENHEEEHATDEHHHEEDGHSEDNHHHEEDGHSEDDHGHHEEEHTEDEHAHEESEHAEDDHDHNHDIDPHVWIDPLYAKEMALKIKEALLAELPEHSSSIEENFSKLEKELESLHAEFLKTINEAKRKEIIVTHGAFGYWEKRYGLKQISISGLSTTSEPSQKDLEKIIKLSRDNEIKYIFFEQNVTSKLGDIIKNEIGAIPLKLHNLSTLTEENISNKENYISLMQQNIEALSTALND